VATGEPYDDLIQVATIGLVKAVDRFDPERGTSVQAYAERFAEGELRHHFRDGGLVRLPIELYTRVRLVCRTAEQLAARLGRQATPAELAARLRLRPAQVLEALEALRLLDARSLDAAGPDANGDQLSQLERIGEEDPRYELIEARSAIEGGWRALDPREREALRLRIVEDLTYREIATRLGMSATHAVRLARRALGRLREIAREEDD
jgi:RNA polymerase sigma-B factor